MNEIYRTLGFSKQAFHQKLDRQMAIEEEKLNLLLLVDEIRKEHPVLSARKMYKMVCPVTMGRDIFERICLENGYGVIRKVNYARTTNSLGVSRFDNLIAGLELTGVNQVLVSDITYYYIRERFYYISFIMDLFSRKVKGFSVSKDLLTINTTIPALKMAGRNLGNKKISSCIFHSDGGGQYYCKEFLELTKSMGLKNSMSYSVYENAHAERVNGIIKNEYLIHYAPVDFKSLEKQVKRAITNYHNRPHQILNGLSPNQFETMLEDKKIKVKMKISDYKESNPFDLMHKGNVDLEPVKGMINGSNAQAIPSPPLTEPKSTVQKVFTRSKRLKCKIKNNV